MILTIKTYVDLAAREENRVVEINHRVVSGIPGEANQLVQLFEWTVPDRRVKFLLEETPEAAL